MKELVRRLRKEQTDTEAKLWDALRNRELLGFEFRRQHTIGSSIVDFCCLEKKIISDSPHPSPLPSREREEEEED